MRAVSSDLAKVLEGGQFVGRLVLDVFYGAERTMRDVPVGDGWQLKWSRAADVPGSGRVLAHYTSERGESMAPQDFTDALATYGQEVAPRLVFKVGDREESVQVGRWLIDDVPSARDDTLRVLDRLVTVNSFVELVLLDQLERVRAAGFTKVESAPAGARAWAEMQRLSGMKILQVGADPLVPSTMKYPLEEGGRLTAVQTLAKAIGGTPYVLADGTLTVLPFARGVVVRRFTHGENGTIFDLPYSMSKEGIANQIVGVFEDAGRNPIVVPPAEQTTGPLAVSGPLGPRTRYVTSADYPLAQTPEAVTAVLRAELERATSTQTVRVPVETVLDPRIECGDLVELERATSTDTGVVADVTYRSNWTMQMLVDVVQRTQEDNAEA